jgi:hypothetical protein
LESYYTEFKEKVNASFTRELVAMANASGGRILLVLMIKTKLKGLI